MTISTNHRAIMSDEDGARLDLIDERNLVGKDALAGSFRRDRAAILAFRFDCITCGKASQLSDYDYAPMHSADMIDPEAPLAARLADTTSDPILGETTVATWKTAFETVKLRVEIAPAEAFIIFLQTHLASVTGGEFDGSDIGSTGRDLVFYVKRNGERAETIKIEIAQLFSAATAASVNAGMDAE